MGTFADAPEGPRCRGPSGWNGGLEMEKCGQPVLVEADDHLIINHQGRNPLRT